MASIFDMLAPSLQIGSTILSAGSQFARGEAVRTVGRRKRGAAEFEAKQRELSAEEARGGGMRAAQDEVLKTELVNSTALARAAASGAGASDPTVISILARTAGEGAYRQAVALYQGEAAARSELMRAAAARLEGDIGESDAESAQKFANLGGISTALSGGARALSMYDKYWTGPKTAIDTGIS